MVTKRVTKADLEAEVARLTKQIQNVWRSTGMSILELDRIRWHTNLYVRGVLKQTRGD